MDESSLFEDHFLCPRGAGPLPGADLSVRVENEVCGDRLVLHVKRTPDGLVGECGFQVYGCPASLACGSALTELLTGHTSEGCGSLTAADVMRAVGGLDDGRAHAAELAESAVRELVRAWRADDGSPPGESNDLSNQTNTGASPR